MKLAFVEIEGFRGFREKARFDLSGGFTVLSGRNGSGKSTFLDAIEFALTGTLSKFDTTAAKGGGLEAHIWWVGSGKPASHQVTVGFIDQDGRAFVITRSRASGCDTKTDEIMRRLSHGGKAVGTSLATLIQTTLIRDEKIAALSLDLPEQARFAAVRAAIGGLIGPDHSPRTSEIFEAVKKAKVRQQNRIAEVQAELGRLLGEITEAKSAAERSRDISDALRTIEKEVPSLAPDKGTGERLIALRSLIAEKRIELRDIEVARTLAETLVPELTFFASPEAGGDLASALAERERLNEERIIALERFQVASHIEQTERESDLFASHLAVLLEHGSALGLQEGHCPLCDALRTGDEFDRAIAAARGRLADRGTKLAAARAASQEAAAVLASVDEKLATVNRRIAGLEDRKKALDQGLARVQDVYNRRRFAVTPNNPKLAQSMLFAEQERFVRLERALAILDSSNAVERVTSLESRIAALRSQSEKEAAKLAKVERAVESARQIHAAAQTVANEILTEQFDTVMPLLKELYRRLRPHADWSEIDSDFGGKIRASLNFVVGDGHNPQFLFSSGQRRAAGMAFLLAVHMSRPWCAWKSLLLDDPVQHIDDYRALNLVEVLAAIRRTGRQVIVAVEDSALGDLLCRRLRSGNEDIGRYYELRVSNTGTSRIDTEREVYPMPRLVLRPAQAS